MGRKFCLLLSVSAETTLGAKGGAMLGAEIGIAILPGVGTAVGAAAGGLILGIVGSHYGDKLGNYIVDITVTEGQISFFGSVKSRWRFQWKQTRGFV